MRFWLAERRLYAPIHSNAYGALIRRAVEVGLLRRTSKLVSSRSPTSKCSVRRDYAVIRPRPLVFG